jgi:hypothetical protein
LGFGGGNTKAASDPRHGKGSPSTRPLRCRPYATVAGRRDDASRLITPASKGPVQRKGSLGYYLRESAACMRSAQTRDLFSLLILCKTGDTSIHFFP